MSDIGDSLSGFHEPVQAWFRASFGAPTRVQQMAWPVIRSGANALVLAPTGSGKTLAAFLAAIDSVMFDPPPPKDRRCRVLYISPLKALAVDVERNLRAPLVGTTRYAERMGVPVYEPQVAIRTGDTPSRDRAAFARHPADILITTPESLYLLLTSAARETLRSVRTVIIDEIHAMVSTKRGSHLALSLERLQELTAVGFQRIGLSATQRPLDEVARFLGGYDNSEEPKPRQVEIVDAGSFKELDLCVEVPVEDMARINQVREIPSGPASQGETRGSIWPAIHPLILDLIRTHRSTLIFVNSRRLAERLAAALNDLAGEEIVHAHHGSIAREQRLLIENELKSGRLPAMVATSSLELGIDMGAIDLVIQVEAPPSVASGIQRIGRAGHRIGEPSKGVIIPKYRGDLLACAALTERMKAGAVELMRYPRNPLDILAQQIVAMVAMDDWHVEHLARVVRRAAPFAELPLTMMDGVLDMLSGRYPSDEFAELRPRITWDRLNGTLHSREGAKRVAVINGGTIPDRGLYGVFLLGAEKGHGRVGELDEEMVFESRVGDVFLLGATSWRIEEITHDRVVVSPAPATPGRMPFWKGESAGRPLEFGRAIGALTRELLGMEPAAAEELLRTRHSLDQLAARNLLQYLSDQQEAIGVVPDDRTIVIESYMDEMGDWRVCILSPFGSRIHAPWAMAIGAMMRAQSDTDVDILWTDDGIVVRFPEADEPPQAEAVIPDPDEVEDLVVHALSAGGAGAHESTQNALFASRFRESAARALLLPRKHPGQRAPLWQQRRRSADLRRATARFGSFPIILETFRECLKDIFDMPALVGFLRDIRSRDVRVVTVTSRTPSPFAAALMFSYVANFIYEGDAPMAERRAQALTVDPAQLRELLGEVELRDLLDPDSLEAFELYLQHLTPERAAKHADGLHDLLIRLGDLSHSEVLARTASTADTPEWIERLIRERRIVTIPIGGEPRYIAAEDAGRYRDALGIPPPPGLPDAFLEYGRDPMGDLVSRFTRTHGPFKPSEIAERLGIGVGPVMQSLRTMERSGRAVEGEFRPGGTGKEWCDAGVLRAIRQKSLARLRHEVEPVEQAALGRLYAVWQGVEIQPAAGAGDRQAGTREDSPSIQSGLGSRRNRSLLEVVEQLQDAAIPASVLETEVLPSRLRAYDPREMDALMSSGAVIWTGCEPLGQHDGRVALYVAEHAHLLARGGRESVPTRSSGPDPEALAIRPAAATWEPGAGQRGVLAPLTGSLPGTGDLHEAILDHLAIRGASFFPQILAATGGGFQNEALEALWDLVWSGNVTNDTLQPLRAYLHPRRGASRGPDRTESRSRRPAPMSRLSVSVSPRPLLARTAPGEASGRWSLVSSLLAGDPTPTERLAARTQVLLDRYGVLTREAVQSEGIPGGFSSVYGVLKGLEEAGRVRRGYFVAGLGATQFAMPGAVDRLRSLRDSQEEPVTVALAATDPANPYGAALPWPERSGTEPGRRPMRMAGAIVILIDGTLAAWMGRGERQLLTFFGSAEERNAEDAATQVAGALANLVVTRRRRSITIDTVDGAPAHENIMAPRLREAGFLHTTHGFLKRP